MSRLEIERLRAEVKTLEKEKGVAETVLAEVVADRERLRPLALRWQAVADELNLSLSPDETEPGAVAVFDIREIKQVRDTACIKLSEHRFAAAAYAVDRALQYDASSGARAALERYAQMILLDEHIKALEHGEIDDLMAWARRAGLVECKVRRGIAPPERDSSGGYKVSR